MFDTELPKKQKKILIDVEDEFFYDDVVSIAKTREGMKVTSKNLILGCMAGPGMDLGNLMHEMGHLAEIDDARAASYGWGLTLREVEVLGQMYKEPLTSQATEREIRVLAYQINLHKHFGIGSAQSWIDSLKYMPDFLYIPGYFRVYGEKGEKAGIKYCTEKAFDLAKLPKYSFESFVIEWKRKLEVVRNLLTQRKNESIITT